MWCCTCTCTHTRSAVWFILASSSKTEKANSAANERGQPLHTFRVCVWVSVCVGLLVCLSAVSVYRLWKQELSQQPSGSNVTFKLLSLICARCTCFHLSSASVGALANLTEYKSRISFDDEFPAADGQDTQHKQMKERSNQRRRYGERLNRNTDVSLQVLRSFGKHTWFSFN